jgi:hypothetical protein
VAAALRLSDIFGGERKPCCVLRPRESCFLDDQPLRGSGRREKAIKLAEEALPASRRK